MSFCKAEGIPSVRSSIDVYKRQGYDNMFCDEHDPSELEHRPLKRYEIPASKLVLELGYSID